MAERKYRAVDPVTGSGVFRLCLTYRMLLYDPASVSKGNYSGVEMRDVED